MNNEFIGSLIVGLSAVIGLFFTVGKPVASLTKTLTRIETNLEDIFGDFKDHKAKNRESNGRIFNKLEQHDDKIVDHEIRLTKLEK